LSFFNYLVIEPISFHKMYRRFPRLLAVLFLFCTNLTKAQTYESANLTELPVAVTKAKTLLTQPAPNLGPKSAYQGQAIDVGMFDVSFSENYADEARDAILFAAGILDKMFNLTDTVEVMCNFNVAASANNLGSCSPDKWHIVNNVYAPQALAKQLTDESNLSNPSEFDLTLNMNSGRTDWYFGTDGNCPAGQYDFVSIAMHEIIHGLGFTGRFGFANNGYEYVISEWDEPSTYDNLVADGSGTLITNLTTTEAAAAIVTDVEFSGASTMAQNGNLRPDLYAPSTWNGGSSYSHFDESYFATGTLNSLMTPFIGNGEVNHTPGPVGLALMQDIGYSVNLTFGCTDPEGCNYDPEANFDDGSCITTGKTCMTPGNCNYDPSGTCHDESLCSTIENVFLPLVVGDGPAIYDCTLTPPSGYYLVPEDEDYCVAATLFTEASCLLENWDGNCANIFSLCQYGPLYGCMDPLACNYDEEANTHDGSCQFGDWILPGPFDGELLPAFALDCDEDGNDYLNDCSLCWDDWTTTETPDGIACVISVMQADNYCLSTDWDNICQDAYESCLPVEGCMNPLACNYNADATMEGFCFFAGNYYLPNNLTGAWPIDVACNPFDLPGSGYSPAESGDCVQFIVTETPTCGTNWDSSCQAAYEACISTEVFGCTDPLACNYDPDATAGDWSCLEADYLLIPSPEFVGTGLPMLPFCGDPADFPTGYTSGDEACIAEVALNDSYCYNVQWDNVCQNAYLNCINPGCTNQFACNYNAEATVNDGSCLFFGSPCDDGNPCTAFSSIDSNCNCVGFIMDTDDDGICNAQDCQPNDPNFPDAFGHCEPVAAATCDDPTAFNYDPSSSVPGLCVYRPEACNEFYMIDPGVLIGSIGGAWSNQLYPLYSDFSTPFQHILMEVGDPDHPYWDGDLWYSLETNKPVTVQFSYALDAAGQDLQPYYRIDEGGIIVPGTEVMLPTDQPFDPSFDFFPEVDLLPSGQITPGDLYTFPPYDLIGLTDEPDQVPDIPYQAVMTVQLNLGDRLTFGYFSDPGMTQGKMLINSIIHNFTCTSGYGCTYDAACNYYGLNQTDDGSCEFPQPGFDCDGNIIEIGFPGCTYPEACNYDDDAENDDGSCTFPEPGFDCFGQAVAGDGYNPTCPSDIDQDGMVAINDLLLLLGEFGDACE
jgi:hypothetical protein